MQVLAKTKTYRDAVEEMWANVNVSLPEAMHLLRDVKFDQDFDALVSYLEASGIPLCVVSAGLTPIVDSFMAPYQGKEGSTIEVRANGVEIGPSWKILYRDDSEYGHDKGLPLRQLKEKYGASERPITVFIGDGISDISAAKHADFVFAKKGKDLEKWCLDEGVPHIAWDRLGVVVDWVKKRMEELG
ncbi:hypothetical protein HK101_011619 [Irineochytrium annulatum]|nr:hypothetical protein HK101_011619 [Irineochytrium annulatum]